MEKRQLVSKTFQKIVYGGVHMPSYTDSSHYGDWLMERNLNIIIDQKDRMDCELFKSTDVVHLAGSNYRCLEQGASQTTA